MTRHCKEKEETVFFNYSEGYLDGVGETLKARNKRDRKLADKLEGVALVLEPKQTCAAEVRKVVRVLRGEEAVRK